MSTMNKSWKGEWVFVAWDYKGVDVKYLPCAKAYIFRHHQYAKRFVLQRNPQRTSYLWHTWLPQQNMAIDKNNDHDRSAWFS